jgi:hypothetical protein
MTARLVDSKVHGDAGLSYSTGCRCTKCTAANTAYVARWRAAQRTAKECDMDPDIAFDELIGAVLTDNWDVARERVSQLKAWRAVGGFTPADPRGQR